MKKRDVDLCYLFNLIRIVLKIEQRKNEKESVLTLRSPIYKQDTRNDFQLNSLKYHTVKQLDFRTEVQQ